MTAFFPFFVYNGFIGLYRTKEVPMKIHRIIPCFLLLLAALTMSAAADEPDFRALWVSTVYNLDYPSQKGLSAQALQDEADALLDLAARCGLNAIVLQVRP